MTRKDYIALANAINKARARIVTDNAGKVEAMLFGSRLTTWEIANVLQEDNPAFDRQKFLDVCNKVTWE